MFVEGNLCIFAAPTFAKVMKAYLINSASTLYNGPIQVCPNDVLSEISNQSGSEVVGVYDHGLWSNLRA